MLYISHTGCQWRFLPESFGPWTRVWSQFRRWSRNGTWARALTVLHRAAREADGRTEATPPVFRPIRHAWRVEVAHGRLGRARRLAKSFENTTTSATGWLQVACIATTLRHLSAVRGRRRRVPLAA
jgi:transposase